MQTGTATCLSPGATRVRAYRRRQREDLSLATCEVPWPVVETLIAHGYISEEAALDRKLLGAAILSAAVTALRRNRAPRG